MDLCVIGTGYVGLVTGACFAEMGNEVWCVDVDAAKIEGLKAGRLPIYEPGLDEIVVRNHREGRLRFTTDLGEAMEACEVLFIAVGTPPREDGSADLQHVLTVARDIGRRLSRYSVIVDKSTVPVGTAERVRRAIQDELEARRVSIPFDVVSNPEFLKEGAAVEDFMRPDRIIVGSDSEAARERMAELYAPFNRSHQRVIYMGVRDAEMTKYAANAMLATKISFMNEIAALCERYGVDVENVRIGIGSDQRIGYHFIYPGCGYGGSCFPKDVKALIAMAQAAGVEPEVLTAVEERNAKQKRALEEKIVARFGEALAGRTFGVWGLAFKPGTDDMREAPSIPLIEGLIGRGAKVRAYDPVAMDNARRVFPAQWFDEGRLVFTQHQYGALEEADAMVLVTEWKPFRHPDFAAIKRLLKTPLIFDGRNQYDPQQLELLGIAYVGIGRANALAQGDRASMR
ncbi:MAG: UDP-glucose/GDP-mannose dehydrogenase family protein [Rhodocyclales bacterium]|nr:UDP-glucose/GDP-mannose dehydrogenase family protein [Rhodocyclales bacterium]